MADVLNTAVDNTNAAGLYHSPSNVGNATVFKEPDLTPDKILMYAIQNGEEQKKKGDRSLKEMNDALNKIKVEGYIQDQQELQKKADNIVNKATNFGVNYKRGYQDYKASDPVQAKDYAEIQKAINELEYDRQTSLDFQKWVANVNQKKNLLSASGSPVRASTGDEVSKVMKMPLSERKAYIQEHGTLPDIDPQFNYAKEGIQTGRLLGSDLKVIENQLGRVITSKNQQDSRIIKDKIDTTAHELLGQEGSTQRATNWAQQLLEDEIQNHPDVSPENNYNNALTKVKSLIQNGMDVQYKDVASPVATAQAKEKAIVGQPVAVDRIVTAPATDKDGAAYIPLQYGGKSTYFDKYAPITAKDDQKLKSFAGSVSEIYKVVKTNQGNFKTEIASAEEKSNFHPAGTMSNSKTGEAALIMTAKSAASVEPTDSQIKAQMTDAEFKEYQKADDDRADAIYAEARKKALEKSTKGTEEVQYIAPIDAALESKYNTLVSQPLNQTFPERKSWTNKKEETPDDWNKKWSALKSGEKLVGLDGKTYTKQ